jgi:hypothetical protein
LQAQSKAATGPVITREQRPAMRRLLTRGRQLRTLLRRERGLRMSSEHDTATISNPAQLKGLLAARRAAATRGGTNAAPAARPPSRP